MRFIRISDWLFEIKNIYYYYINVTNQPVYSDCNDCNAAPMSMSSRVKVQAVTKQITCSYCVCARGEACTDPLTRSQSGEDELSEKD